jgi:galactonate dehydratase
LLLLLYDAKAMNRRRFVAAVGLTPVALGAAPQVDRRASEITVSGAEIFRVRVNRLGNWVIVRVQTSAGLSGLGDASHSGRGDPSVGKLTEFASWMTGRSIYDIEGLRQRAYPEVALHGRAASCAHSAIEQALYDIQGQAAGVPTYQLFGGKLRDTVRNYANINRSTEQRGPAGFAKMAESAVAAGFDAIKLAPFDGMPSNGSAAEIEAHTQLGIDSVRAVRDVLGPGGDLLIDAHSHFDRARGMDLLRRLEPLNLYWLEEVTRPLEDLAAINEAAPMPTAGGESLFGLQENLEYIRAGAVDILMPDVKYCGGMLELKKIAAVAEGAGMPASPHGPASPVGNVAAAQVCVGLPNFQILEFSHGETDWRSELIDPPEALATGMLTVSDRPGFGIRLNEKTVAMQKPD